MLAVEKWAQDKPSLIAFIAPQIADFAREIPELIKNQKKHRFLNHAFPVPDLPSWYAFYRSHRRYINPFTEMLYNASEYSQELIGLGQTFQDLSRNKEQLKEIVITPELIKEGQTYWKDLLQLSFADLRDNWYDKPLSPEERAVLQQYKDDHEPALAFLFLVVYPCLLFYKEWPSVLYRKAIKGDYNTIHKLLRLDPFLLHDQAIGKRIQHIRIHGRQNDYEELLKAPLKPIKIKLTSRTIKDMLAGLISFLADSIMQPLTSTEIRQLFDAVAKDAEKRDIDTSLPDSPEGYSKVIQRNRHDWKPLLPHGQKIVK